MNYLPSEKKTLFWRHTELQKLLSLLIRCGSWRRPGRRSQKWDEAQKGSLETKGTVEMRFEVQIYTCLHHRTSVEFPLRYGWLIKAVPSISPKVSGNSFDHDYWQPTVLMNKFMIKPTVLMNKFMKVPWIFLDSQSLQKLAEKRENKMQTELWNSYSPLEY